MSISLKHLFASPKADGPDPTLVQPSNWNAEHVLNMAPLRLVGRTTAGTGPAEEIAVGANLSLLGGTLNLASDITVTALTLDSVPITATGTEINYVDGVTSPIQAQLDAKAPLANPTFTGTVTSSGNIVTGSINAGSANAGSLTTTSLTASGSTLALSTATGHAILLSTSGIERARITAAGDLHVGRTVGDFSTNGATIQGDGLGIFVRDGAACTVMNRNTNNGTVIQFRRSNNLVGSIDVTTTATSYLTSSDYRLKEHLQPVADPIARLKSLNPINFAWKSDGSRVDDFLAHEVQAVVPEAVIGSKDEVDADGRPVYQGIDQAKLVPLLTAALQAALTKIDALEARFAALEGGA